MLNGTNPNNPKYQRRISRDPSFDWENRLRRLAEICVSFEPQSEALLGTQVSKTRVYSAARTICRISHEHERRRTQ